MLLLLHLMMFYVTYFFPKTSLTLCKDKVMHEKWIFGSFRDKLTVLTRDIRSTRKWIPQITFKKKQVGVDPDPTNMKKQIRIQIR